jgi:long-chain acyl-CoA synthetase
MLIDSARANSKKIAFNVLRDGRWARVTYGEFLGMAEAACTALRGEGLTRGARAAIVAENRPEWCAFYLGTLMVGAVAVPIDMRLTPGEIKNILAHSESELVVCSNETEEAVRKAAEGLDIKMLNIDTCPLDKTAEEVRYEDASEGDLASLLYTSGTTGIPKAVMLTHGNLCSDAEAIGEVNIIGAGDNVLSALPLHHTYPFMGTFVLPLSLGASVTYPAGLKGPEIAEAARATGVTLIIAVPLMLELMRDRVFNRLGEFSLPISAAALWAVRVLGYLREKLGINIARYVFARRLGGRFRFFASGGARLEPAVMKDLEALGFTVVEGYGLTETSPIIAFNPIDKRKPGSVGRPVKGAEIRILNPSESGEGEVALRGPMLMQGYYKNPEATASAIRDGWFLSGDLGRIDGEGYLFITGRAKEVIVLGSGKNVYPEDVEKLYSEIPLIREICVLGTGGRLHAVIVPEPQGAGENLEEALRNKIKNLSEGIASHMRIMGYTLTDGPLPRTPLGKLRRFMVADILKGKKEKKQEDPALLKDETSLRVVKCLRRLAGESGPVRADDDLEFDLGLDSLKRLEMVVSVETEFSVKLPDSFAHEVRTVGELIKRIKDSGSGAPEAGGADAAPWGVPTGEEKKRAGLVRGALEWPVSAAFTVLLKLVFKMFFGLDVKGVEKIPEPPFIIAPNHASNLDGFVVASAVSVRTFGSLYFQGYYTYFTGPLGALFGRLAHVISVDPGKYLNSALRLSHHVLGGGSALCIFPEGQRSFDGSLGEFKRGVGILALKLDVPVVPAKIEGAFGVLPREAWLPRPGRIKIRFGDPVKPSSVDYSQMPEGVDREQFFADVLRDRVSGL